MSEILTEEQQLAEIRQWLEKYGKMVVLVCTMIALGYFGNQGWEQYQKVTAQTASALYQEMTVTIAAIDQDKSNQDKAVTLANRLKSEFKRTTYAQFAALFIAKLAVAQKKYDEAIAELEWVLERKPDEPVHLITQLRLSRVWLAKGDATKALSIIENVEAGAFTATYEELKGDIYSKLGKTDEARAAYQKGVDAAKKADTLEYRSILEMKLDDLAVTKGVTK